MRKRAAATLITGWCCVLCSCSADRTSTAEPAPPALPAGARIGYTFTTFADSSVPPQYHPSWTLSVTAARAAIAVDSDGDVLAERSVATPPEVWAQLDAGFPAVLESAGLADRRTTPDTAGCTGATSQTVRVEDGPNVVVDQRVIECGGTNADVADTLRSWIAPARALFPPTDELAPPAP